MIGAREEWGGFQGLLWTGALSPVIREVWGLSGPSFVKASADKPVSTVGCVLQARYLSGLPVAHS